MIKNIAFTGQLRSPDGNNGKFITRSTTNNQDRIFLESWNQKLDDPKTIQNAKLHNDQFLILTDKPNGLLILEEIDSCKIELYHQNTEQRYSLYQNDVSAENLVLYKVVFNKLMNLKNTVIERNIQSFIKSFLPPKD